VQKTVTMIFYCERTAHACLYIGFMGSVYKKCLSFC